METVEGSLVAGVVGEGCVGGGIGRAQDFQGSKTTPYDTAVVHTRHYTSVQTHRVYDCGFRMVIMSM